MIHIGHERSTLDATGKLIERILATSNGDAVKIAAVQAVATALSIQASISNCRLETK